MSDDRFAWLGSRPRGPRPIPETSLWTVERAGYLVEARRREVELGPELRVFLDGELLWTQVIRDGTLEQLSADTRAHWDAAGTGPA